jgi:alpha-glucoside transport system substrate-binding protein
VVPLALAAAACAGGGEPAYDDDLAGEEIEVLAKWTGIEEERFGRVLAAFEAATGASVVYTAAADSVATTVGARLDAGDPPDVAIVPQPGLIHDLAARGQLVELDEVAGHEVSENYADVWRRLGTFDGDLYGVWFKAANKSLVWYHLGVFERAGLNPPEELEDLLEGAPALRALGVAPVSVAGATGWTLTDWFENVYLRSAGAERYDRLARHELRWTDPSVVEALTLLTRLWSPEVVAGGRDGALRTDYTTSVTQTFADPPVAAMVMEGDFVAGVIGGQTAAEVGVDADVVAFPAVDGSPPAVIGGGDAVVLLEDGDAGRALVEFLAQPEAAEVWVSLGGFVSPNQAVDVASYPDEATRQIARAVLDAGDNFRFDLSDLQPAAFGSTPGQGMWARLQELLAGASPLEVAQALEADATAAYAADPE